MTVITCAVNQTNQNFGIYSLLGDALRECIIVQFSYFYWFKKMMMVITGVMNQTKQNFKIEYFGNVFREKKIHISNYKIFSGDALRLHQLRVWLRVCDAVDYGFNRY